MKAWVLHSIGDIRYEDVNISDRKDAALLEVKAVGICGSDIPRVYKTGAHKMPLIPGHEFAGVIREISCSTLTGDNSLISNDFTVGMRCGVFPLIPCRSCEPCRDEQYEMCRNYDYLGSRSDGGFAEYVMVPVSNLIKLPDNVSYEQAAMLEPSCVALHAIRRIDEKVMKASPSAAIIGLGTIGFLVALQLRFMGIDNITLICNKESQIQRAESLGFKAVISGSMPVLADIVFECVGSMKSLINAIEIVRPAGNVVTVGNPEGDMTLPKNVYWKILRDQIKLHGTWNSSFTGKANDDWHVTLDGIASKSFAPEALISHRFSLEELDKGLHIMKDKTEDYCKIMICR